MASIVLASLSIRPEGMAGSIKNWFSSGLLFEKGISFKDCDAMK